MFSRKKRFWEKKGFYAGIATAALAAYSLSLLLAPPEEDIVDIQETNDTTKSVVKSEKVSNNEKIKNKLNQKDDTYVYDDDYDYEDSEYISRYDDLYDEDESDDYEENTDEEYYLIIEENGLIKIYECDLDGGKKLVRTTDISYSLLYEDDQQMFSDGIMVETEDELMEILQDFES